MSAVDRDLLKAAMEAAKYGHVAVHPAQPEFGEPFEYDMLDRDEVLRLIDAAPELLASEPPPSDPWNDLLAEARAFEDWYLPTRMSVNAWVGVDTTSGLYGGWTVEGDPLYDEWDESVMTTAAGDTPASVIVDLIRIARDYRSRRDAERVEDERDEQTVAALRDSGVRS